MNYYIVATTCANLDDENTPTRWLDITLTGNTQPTGLMVISTNQVNFLSGAVVVGDVVDGELITAGTHLLITFEGEEGQVLDLTLDSDDFDPLLYIRSERLTHWRQ